MVLSRAGFAGLALLAAALAFAVACGSGEPKSWGERWAELGVPEAEFGFLGDFTDEEQASIRLELKTAQVVFAERFGVVVSDFTVYVMTNDIYEERMAAVLHEQADFALACGLVAPDQPVIIVPGDCPEGRSQGAFLAHEYFRILQQDAGGLAWRQQVGTVRSMAWLDWIEAGSAAYASALVSDATGGIPLNDRREETQLRWAELAQPFPRNRGDIADPAHAPVFTHHVGLLATEWLAEQAGPEAILKFFQFGGHAAAFEAAFGMTLDEFHDAFEQHRLEVAPPAQ